MKKGHEWVQSRLLWPSLKLEPRGPRGPEVAGARVWMSLIAYKKWRNNRGDIKETWIFTIWGMLDVTGFNEYNINLNSVIGNDARCTKIEEGVMQWILKKQQLRSKHQKH